MLMLCKKKKENCERLISEDKEEMCIFHTYTKIQGRTEQKSRDKF